MLDATGHVENTHKPQYVCGEGPSKNVILKCINSTHRHTAKSITLKKIKQNNNGIFSDHSKTRLVRYSNGDELDTICVRFWNGLLPPYLQSSFQMVT
jgi:hypothetical protein